MEDVTLTIQATDTGIGLHETPYSFDGGESWQETGEYTYTQSTKTQIQVKDKAGNIAVYDFTINIKKVMTKRSM